MSSYIMLPCNNIPLLRGLICNCNNIHKEHTDDLILKDNIFLFKEKKKKPKKKKSKAVSKLLTGFAMNDQFHLIQL